MRGRRFDPVLVLVIVLGLTLGSMPHEALVAVLAALLMSGITLGVLYVFARIVLPPAPRPPRDRR